MASNFDFLAARHRDLFVAAAEAEAQVHRSPRLACFQARFALERTCHWLYRHDPDLRMPYDRGLGALIHEQSFRDNLPRAVFDKVRLIQQLGNKAAHEARAPKLADALQAVRDLFHFLFWVARMYAPADVELADRAFDPALLPRPQAAPVDDRAAVAALEKRLAASDEMARIEAERRQQTEAEVAALKAQVAALKAANVPQAAAHDYDEAQTRDRFIDGLLVEAGWDPEGPNVAEYEVEGMPKLKPGASGRGFVDYVLWGADGRPLALVEAKRSRKGPDVGAHQAKLYADCLEKRFGRRPVIFLTNGHAHWIWDDARYVKRPVAGFYTRAELERLHYRRANAKRLSLVLPDAEIAGRPYQLEAIRRITEVFDKRGRKALLVMATGTGKTRTAIALVDLLKRAGWVKRVLFLADRNALLRQAKRAFTKHLPAATAVDITQDKGGVAATVVLSTYPTMFNRVVEPEGRAAFGPGHFDLVIVDEAHRSIYKKYGALFDYFDGLLVGLTATPRDEVERDTYRVFDLEPGVPTAFYELDEAILDEHLVPPRGVSVPFAFLRRGIKYAELSDEAKAEYEDKLRDEETDEVPDEVNAAAINKWLFNVETVDRAIELLMQRGLKIDDGQRLGKTIVFARNQDHANFIAKRFDKAYPKWASHFAQVITSKVSHAQSLLDDFATPGKAPTIAISVDMLDTGVDVPECVNLVFFKPVYSRVKFNQMIGRGTRLCPDLNGPGKDKACFLVFDLCGNFEYFAEDLPGQGPRPVESVGARVFTARLGLAQRLKGQSGDDAQALAGQLLNGLHAQVASMTLDNYLVRRERPTVEAFAVRERWDDLSDADIEQVSRLADLPDGLPAEPFEALQFDLLGYRLMIARLEGSKAFVAFRDRVRDLASRLEELATIPMVNKELALIAAVQSVDWWTDIDLKSIDDMRRRLRGLVQFIERKARPPVYTDLPDPLADHQVIDGVEVPLRQTGFSPGQYRKKVQQIVRDNQDHVSIAKLRRNQPLTPTDLTALEGMLFDEQAVGSRAQFEQVFGKDLSLPRFIRGLVGLDRAAAKAAFGRYAADSGFTADQVRFVDMIVDWLTRNGTMDPGLLYEPPFTDRHPDGLDGVFGDDAADDIISIVRGFNAAVGVDYSAGVG